MQFFELKPVSPRQAVDIKQKIGIDTSGFSTQFEDRRAKHIEKDHGPNGEADTTMKDVSDVARIQYVIDNYDNIEDGGTTKAYFEFRDGKNRRAKTVLLSKKVNGTYYVVEAAPVTKARSLYIVSAYMNKKGASHSANTETLSQRHGATEGELAPKNNVAQESKNVNAAADNDLGAKRSEFQSEPKQSQTQWNTLGAIESQNDVPADVQEPIMYDTISEKQSLENARLRLGQDYAGEMSELRSKTNWSGEESANACAEKALNRQNGTIKKQPFFVCSCASWLDYVGYPVQKLMRLSTNADLLTKTIRLYTREKKIELTDLIQY